MATRTKPKTDFSQLTLSIIIPCYNEERTIEKLLHQVLTVDLGPVRKDIIIIDDASQDKSREISRRITAQHPDSVRVFAQPKNEGKGSAVRRGLAAAQGELIVIQDADLEYHPQDFRQMLSLFSLPQVDVVFGSRRLLADNPVSGPTEYIGAQLINFFTNILYGAQITDQFTCYKMFRRRLVDRLKLRTSRYEFDAELTAKLLRLGTKVQEVPIRYSPRTRAEGKKIRWRDGGAWLWQIIKHRFTRRNKW